MTNWPEPCAISSGWTTRFRKGYAPALPRSVGAARALLTSDRQRRGYRYPRPSGPNARFGSYSRIRVGAHPLWVFPERRAKLPMRDEDMLPLPQRLNAAQRIVLNALTKKSDIWNTRSGNVSLAFRRVQLPHDRASILQCLA